MKRTILPLLLCLCLVAIPTNAQVMTDTISGKTPTDSIPDRQDPNNPNPDPDPDDPPAIIRGDTSDPAISAGIKLADFSYSDSRNTSNFTDQYNGRSTNDVFYTFTLTVPMNVTITHQGSIVNDTYMSLLASDLTLIASNNDYCGEGHCANTRHSFIRRQLEPGTYYVVSEGYSNNGIIVTNITGNTSGGFNYPNIPSSYSTEPINAVGAMGGVFGVSPMGGATYSIPIDVPLGVGGLQPQLTVVYNSQAGNGLCGYGANLSGFSSITRGPKDIYHDGQAQGVTYLADDAMYLDGVRLVLDHNSTAGQDGAIYYPESDPFTRIITHGTCSQTANNTWFEVQSGDGMIYWYGKNQDSRLSYTSGSSQRIHSWYICHAQQPTGNYMTYYYQQDGLCIYPYMITYGTNINQTSTLSNIIEFTYETRADSIPIRFDGKHGSMVKRLKNITGSTNGNTFRSYTLNYNTSGDGTAYKFSRLVSVTEKNGQNQQLPPTQLYWSYLPAVSYSSSNIYVAQPDLSNAFASFPVSSQSFMSGDFNGDGLCDIVGIGNAEEPNNNGGYDSYTYVYIYFASISSTGPLQYLTGTDFVLPPGIETDRIKGSVNSMSVVDVDGDGVNELVLPYFVSDSYNSALGLYVLGQHFAVGDGGGATSLYGNSRPLFVSGDIDNDGRTDVAFVETAKHNNSYPLYIWTYNTDYIPGSNDLSHALFDMDVEIPLSLDSQPGHVLLSDINGNGLNDLFVICSDGYAIYWNQGDGLSSNTFSDSYKNTGTNLVYHDMTSFGDFNGDGLLDVISKESPFQWYIYQNNGDGSFSKSTAFVDNILSACSLENFHCDVLDFDGDDISDIIITENISMPPLFSSDNTRTIWLRSTGVLLEKVYEASSCRSVDALARRYITGDFDGDGRVELINYGYDCVSGVNSNSDPVWRIYKNSSLTAQSGKVTSITGDFGATTGITYSTLTDPGVYTRGNDEPYPAPRYTVPLNVVRQTVQDGGATGSQTVNYSYSGLKVHLRGKGALGFTRTVSNNTSAGVRTESGITQWDTAHYIPRVTYSKTTIGGSVTQSVSTLTIADKGERRFFAYPSQRVDTDMYGYSTTTCCAYDTAHGYPLSESVIYAAGMYRTMRYLNYTQAGGAYRPQTVVSVQKHPDDASPFSVTTLYSYDASTGAVLQKVDNSSSSKPLTTQYTYDLWGNPTSQVATGAGISTSCTTCYTYDATHRFPVRIYTVPESSVLKYTYDSWGNVLTEQDSINAVVCNTVTNTYNAWGNLVRKQIPGSGEVTFTRGWNSDPAKRWFVLEQGTATPWVKTWYDNNGRQVRTESVGPMNVSVVSYTQFNARGQVTKRAGSSGNLSDWTEYEYSSNGTLFREKHPGDSYIMHSQWTQNDGTHYEQVNDNNRTTNYIYDAMGNLKKVEAPVSTVINTFYSCGGIKTTVAGGATWTFQYDDRGNRTSMTDPDAGTTTYVYDALGRETTRTDGRGVVFVTNYDYLGRTTSTSATLSGHTETISYTYGNSSTGGTGQMQMVSESLNGNTRSFVYDSYGRVTQETMSNGTESKVRTYQYGGDGLLSQRTLPGGVTYAYTYDAYGNQTGVNVAGGALSWSLTGFTGRRTTYETVLDGSSYPFIKTNVLDQYGYPDSIKTSQWGCYYQNEKYVFDPIRGNLTQRSDYSYSSPLSFDYDNADRLTHVTLNNQDIMSMTYAQNGNITSKTGIGSYTYNSSSKPHAVTGVDNTDDLIGYNNQEITYNVWGKAIHVWQEDNTDFYSYSIGYGPDLQRVGSVMYKTYQLQYEKFYWDDYEEKIRGNDTLRYYYVYGADGLAGLLVKESSPSGMTSHSMAALTDHLGSIKGFVDNYDICFDASYDVWGGRDAQYVFCSDFGMDRGFCGHEHIDDLGLINMNGRIYDPQLGRFLSPDPFVQAPTNPQNYNRYAYCLNNPLKYTDPSGEVFVIDDVIVACLVAAVVSTIVDYGMQVAFNYLNGYKGKDAWLNKVDFFDIAVSGVIGAATAGYGTAAKMGSKVGKVGKWVIGNSNAIKTGEILLTSAVDITGEGAQKVSFNQFVSRAAIGLTTQSVTDAVVNHTKSTKVDNSVSFKEQVDNTSLTSKPDNLINENGGNYSVYKGIDEATGKVKYVGITSREPQVRFEEHLRSNTQRSSLLYEAVSGANGLSKTNARIWEQNLINQYGLENLYNKINSISPSYWNLYNIK